MKHIQAMIQQKTKEFSVDVGLLTEILLQDWSNVKKDTVVYAADKLTELKEIRERDATYDRRHFSHYNQEKERFETFVDHRSSQTTSSTTRYMYCVVRKADK
jgi:hypothetical protein